MVPLRRLPQTKRGISHVSRAVTWAVIKARWQRLGGP
jgi:hypothetical protein